MFSDAVQERDWHDRATAPGNDVVRVRGARVRPTHGTRPTTST